MTQKFTYVTEDGRRLDAEIFVSCRDEDGCDATYDFEWLACGEAPVEMTSLSPRDQVDLDRRAQDIADQAAPTAYREYLLGAADAAYDRMKDDY